MTKGMVFYVTAGYTCLLPPCLHSLSGKWSGNVTVVYRNVGNKVIDGIKSYGYSVMKDERPLTKRDRLHRKTKIWLAKVNAHKNFFPYDVNLVLDIDRIFLREFPPDIFERIEDNGLLTCTGKVPCSKSNRIRAHCRKNWGINIPVVYGMDGGFVGSVKGHPVIDKWHEWVERFISVGLKHVPDEHALGVMFQLGAIGAVPLEWSYAIGKCRRMQDGIPGNTRSIHIKAKTCKRYKPFVDAYRAAWDSNYINVQAWDKKESAYNDYYTGRWIGK